MAQKFGPPQTPRICSQQRHQELLANPPPLDRGLLCRGFARLRCAWCEATASSSRKMGALAPDPRMCYSAHGRPLRNRAARDLIEFGPEPASLTSFGAASIICVYTSPHQDSPEAISGAYRRLLNSVLTPDKSAHVAAHPGLDLATRPYVRAGCWRLARKARPEPASLTAAAPLNALAAHTQRLFFEPVVFSTAQLAERRHPLLRASPGVLVLTAENMLQAGAR